MNVTGSYSRTIRRSVASVYPNTERYNRYSYSSMMKVDIDCHNEFLIPNYRFTTMHDILVKKFEETPERRNYRFIFPFLNNELRSPYEVKGGDSALRNLMSYSTFRLVSCGNELFMGNSGMILKKNRAKGLWELIMLGVTKCRRVSDGNIPIMVSNSIMMLHPSVYLMENPVERSLVKKGIYVFTDRSFRYTTNNYNEVVVTQGIENFLHHTKIRIDNPKELWYHFNERPIPF